jgi:hypothetical protein|tara:strand:+ start:1403 stop:2044 length:642 start_codon:yes stop_codon:yes gene_type:complete
VECKTIADKAWGFITDGIKQLYRCYAASDEARSPQVRAARHWNFDLLKHETEDEMFRRLQASLPKKAKIIRIHVSGDFFNQKYFNAWVRIANNNPHILFYAYTKSLKYWIDYAFALPNNLKLTASWDNSNSFVIEMKNLKYARVVFSEEEAAELGLEIDHDDSHAYGGDKSFALLIHGTQPKGSMAAKAKNTLVATGVKHSYARERTRSINKR